MKRAEMLRELTTAGHGPYSSAPARPKHRPGISDAELKALMDSIGTVIRASVVAPLTARVAELEQRVAQGVAKFELGVTQVEQRVAQVEQRVVQVEQRQLSYRGIWESSEHYSPGDLVTHAGSMWLCQSSSTQTPPGSSLAWKLTVKRGRA